MKNIMKNMIGRKFLYPYPYEDTSKEEERLWEVKGIVENERPLRCEIIDKGFEGTERLFHEHVVIMGELVLRNKEQVQSV